MRNIINIIRDILKKNNIAIPVSSLIPRFFKKKGGYNKTYKKKNILIIKRRIDIKPTKRRRNIIKQKEKIIKLKGTIIKQKGK